MPRDDVLLPACATENYGYDKVHEEELDADKIFAKLSSMKRKDEEKQEDDL